MFADISGSTQLYDQQGDEIAKQMIDNCLGHLQVVTEAHKGTVIKKIGDELMCRFESVESAIAAARVSQSEIKNLQSLEKIRLSIRVGVHFGEVIEDNDDIFGDAVNVAARMAGIAKGGQIITTEETVNAISVELKSQTRQVDLTRVKGKQEKLAVFEVLWEQSNEVTRVATELLSRSTENPNKLILILGQVRIELKNESETISIGRDETCDLVVNAELVSRKHAYCEIRRGKFIIVDQGTNGTYVSAAGQDEVYLRREELALRNKGTISLGKPFSDSSNDELIQFEC